jgi:hypothetical protein
LRHTWATCRRNLTTSFRGSFASATPDIFLIAGASHGVSWADFDGDGDLDLALANNNPAGHHPLYRNDVRSGHSLQVMVRAANGTATVPGAEVRVYTRAGELLGTRLVDTGGGYCSQGVTPVHFGLGDATGSVRVEVTAFRGGERFTTERDVDPGEWTGRWISVQIRE